MSKPSLHVIPTNNKWEIRQEGIEDYTAIFSNEKEAVEMAARVAQAEDLPLYIHVGDHTIKLDPESWLNAGSFGKRLARFDD
jgi:hypothetical protein